MILNHIFNNYHSCQNGVSLETVYQELEFVCKTIMNTQFNNEWNKYKRVNELIKNLTTPIETIIKDIELLIKPNGINQIIDDRFLLELDTIPNDLLVDEGIMRYDDLIAAQKL
jgi:hypothetical protein